MPSTPIATVRPAGAADAAALAGFGAASFRAAYAAETPAAALDAFVDELFGVDRQTAELNDPACRVLMAEIDGHLVGYALVRDDPSPPPGVPGARPLLLDRLYVAPSAQGQGVGRALFGAVLHVAAQRGNDVIWLGVWEHNHRAIAIYHRWGFVDAGEVPFDLAGEPQTDRVLVLRRPSG